jgi:sensor histidine kinase YesM
MGIRKERIVYWSADLGGWGAYILLSAVIMEGEGTLTPERGRALLLAYPIGVLLSHGMRFVFVRRGWLRSSIAWLLPRVILLNFLFGGLFFLIHSSLLYGVLGAGELPWQVPPFDIFQSVLNWSLLFFFWSAIYFAYHFFQERRRKEIEALRWEARKSELELQQLKDQLDPHFMFNCLNSIKALIEEDPGKAKRAVAQLSNTLRNGLTLARKTTIPLREELSVIEDHLALEALRLEERLETRIEVPESFLDQPVPPFLVQTLVENGIKHGISELPQGGTLELSVSSEDDVCRIFVGNPKPEEGRKSEQDSRKNTGTGLENARKRLQLLYGGTASLKREEDEHSVRTIIELPLQHVPANDHHR